MIIDGLLILYLAVGTWLIYRIGERVILYVKNVIEVCNVRHLTGLSCRNCQYKGKTCEHAKKILKVGRPFEYKKLIKNEQDQEEKR